MGLFISVDVRNDKLESDELRRRVAECCPVDIFELRDGQVRVRAENEDECTLCDLCLQQAPEGAVVIRKLYEGTSSAPGSANESVGSGRGGSR